MTDLGYTGPSGRTRVERVRVFRSRGEPLEVEVFRVLNVAEHPELREPALEGTLHRLDDGEHVDVPFIYHDPQEQQFVLVIPYAARGRELSERARLLDSLMKEHEEDVPDYVRHFAIVYGRRGLAQYLDDSQTMEVDVAELEPIDVVPVPAGYYPRIAGLLPPVDFWAMSASELAPLVEDDELWLFAQVGDEELGAFTEPTSDLLIQLKTIEQIPIAVLVLADRITGSLRRAYLNPARSVDGRVLELLRRDFHATVVVYDERRELLRSFRLEAPRSANAKLILERTERSARPSAQRWAELVDACREAPPLVGDPRHSFVLEEPAANAGIALERLKRLEAWSDPERIDEALMIASVPRTVFELSRRRVVADALRFGLGMSSELLLQAVRFGLGSNILELVRTLQQRFEEMVPNASAQGLDEREIQRNRELLDRLAQQHGTSTGPMVSCTMEASR